MHLRLAALAVIVTCASCSPPPPETECVRNSDCARGRVCLDGLCVDGVTGGGAATGGGTSGGGMATAGGATAGGLAMAGGVATAGGAAGGALGGGTAGGVAGGSGGGALGGGTAGGQDAGLLDAGVDGGAGAPDAGCQCADVEECVGGLVCVPRYALLQWRAPANGAVFSSGSSVSLEAALLLANGRTRNDPGSLPFEASGDGGRVSGVLQRVDAGLFATSMSFPVGSWAATVALPDAGLADGPLTFSVVPSDFSLTWAAPPVRPQSPGLQPHDPSQDAGTFFRRDETTTLVVTNAVAATNVTVRVFGLTSDGGTPDLALTAAASCAPCTGAGFCACYPLDLSRPALEAFRGRFSFSVSGAVNGVVVTNSSQTHPARVPTLPVTRWKWAWVNGPSAADGGFALTTNAALDRRGTLYFGFTETGASGVKALRHQGDVQLATSGVLVPTTDVVISSPADSGVDLAMVGAQTLGFATITPDGGVTQLCDVGASQGFIASGTAGLVRVSFPLAFDLPFAVSIGTGTQRRLSVGQPFGTCAASSLPPTSQSVKNPLMASGLDISLASAESSSVVTWTANPPSLNPTGVVMLPSMLGSLTDLFPGPVGTGSNGVWVPSQAFSSGGPGGTGVLAAGLVWYPVSGPGLLGLRAVDVNSGVSSPIIELATAGTASVALGQGGAVLAAADTGVLTVVENGRIVWATPADARLGGRFTSRLMLDCSRDGSGAPMPGRPGVAYLVGAPQQVQAVITDSRGLDVTQPWPMNGHDPRGTSNTATSLAPFACP